MSQIDKPTYSAVYVSLTSYSPCIINKLQCSPCIII